MLDPQTAGERNTTEKAPRRMPMMSATDRLDTLDGMRGMAALMVVIYHLFARWAEPYHVETLYPHGNAVSYFPALGYFGIFGVLSFFLISGFVIMMTLERSSGLADFAGRRFCRLWPTMLFCATLSTLVINGSDIAEHYEGAADWEVTRLEYLSSIFFLPPDLVASQLGHGSADWIEGVYWTLWAEVRFYALVALAFLLAPRTWFIWVWAGVQAFSTVLQVRSELGYDYPGVVWLAVQPGYLGWFSLGLCGYLYWSGRMSIPVIIIALMAVIAIVVGMIVRLDGGAPAFAPDALSTSILVAAICTPFVLFLVSSRLVSFLKSAPLVALGLASYPLYLFHERPAMAGLKYTSAAGLPDWLGAALVLAALIGVAMLIHRFVEDPAKHALARIWRPVSRSLEARYAWLRFRVRRNEEACSGAR